MRARLALIRLPGAPRLFTRTTIAVVGAALVAGVLADPPRAGAEPVQTQSGTAELERVAGGLDHPWALAFLPDGAILVTERAGRMRLLADGVLSEPIGGVPRVFATGQGGLLDVAVDRDFASTGRIFFTFSERGEGGAGTAVGRARLVRDGAGARLEDVEVIFRQSPKLSGGAHFGSRIAFAPDGNLFVTLGERNHRDFAQDLSTTLGKVVRITRDGAAPADNPFVGRADTRPEIWSYGHRNPQGAAVDAAGRLWTVEHGARGGDEVNRPQPGKNYGWPVIAYGTEYSGGPIGTGTAAEGMEQPLHYWVPSISPAGLAFYDADAFPAWKGDAFTGGLSGQVLVRLDIADGAVVGEERMLEGRVGRVRDVAVGPDGALYLVTDNGDDAIWRLRPAD
jgi:glucose/arabinose dehydrogenase